jgi:hypothetical protein
MHTQLARRDLIDFGVKSGVKPLSRLFHPEDFKSRRFGDPQLLQVIHFHKFVQRLTRGAGRRMNFLAALDMFRNLMHVSRLNLVGHDDGEANANCDRRRDSRYSE